MEDKRENGFIWPCGHKNKEGVMRCQECGLELTACGIDLGTTNSLCALCFELAPGQNPPFRIEFLIDQENRRITPSVVCFDKETSKFLTGFDAVKNQLLDPENTVYSVKRLMGKRFDNDNVQRLLKRVEYRIVDDGGMASIKLGNDIYSPTEISAEILKRLKIDAEKHFNRVITHAVITVPAYFDDIQRQATIQAGRIAGFFVKRVVSEPVAATYAYGYGLDRNRSGKVLVFDMGGGTFDITIVYIRHPLNLVQIHKGDMWLGGDDVDDKLLERKVNEIEQQYKSNPRVDKRFISELRKKLRRAKEVICNDETKKEVKLILNRPIITYKDNGETECFEIKNFKLSREELKIAALPLIDKAIDLVKQTLKEAELSARDIDHIILVGGSSYLLGIQDRLRTIFPPNRIDEIHDPMSAVGMGAAILAQKIKGMYCEKCDTTNDSTAIKCSKCGAELEPYIDRTHMHYGIEITGGKFEIVLPKGTLCPTQRPLQRIFYTIYDGQKKIETPIYQGERTRAKDNAWQGILTIQLSKGVPADTPVTVSMNINKDRILEVEVECRGKQESAKIKPSNWAWSLREQIKRGEGIPNVSELINQGEQILSKWEIAPPDSGEAHRLSKEGKEILTQLEDLQWHRHLTFYKELIQQILDYKAILDPLLGDLLKDTLEICKNAQINGNEAIKEQITENLNRIFEKIFRDESYKNLLIMILAAMTLDIGKKTANPYIQSVAEDLNKIKELIRDDKVDGARNILKREDKKPDFKQTLKIIFDDFELPGLLKSEIGYGRDINTRPIKPN